jgi:hypothetical protein
MINKNKLSLEGIKIESFITTLDSEELKAVKGGYEDPQANRTAVPIFC